MKEAKGLLLRYFGDGGFFHDEDSVISLEKDDILFGKAGAEFIKVKEDIVDVFTMNTIIPIVFVNSAQPDIIYEYQLVETKKNTIEDNADCNIHWNIVYMRDDEDQEDFESFSDIMKATERYVELITFLKYNYQYIILKQIEIQGITTKTTVIEEYIKDAEEEKTKYLWP